MFFYRSFKFYSNFLLASFIYFIVYSLFLRKKLYHYYCTLVPKAHTRVDLLGLCPIALLLIDSFLLFCLLSYVNSHISLLARLLVSFRFIVRGSNIWSRCTSMTMGSFSAITLFILNIFKL